MDRGRRNLIIVVVDILMLVLIVVACYMLLHQGASSWNKNVCTLLIVLAIPTMFYITATKVVEGRFPYPEEEDEEAPETSAEEVDKKEEKEE